MTETIEIKENQWDNLILPHRKSGVYALYYENEIVYIGKAKNLGARFRQHLTNYNKDSQVEAEAITKITFNVCDYLDLEKQEKILISKYKPRLNLHDNSSNYHPDKYFCFICLKLHKNGINCPIKVEDGIHYINGEKIELTRVDGKEYLKKPIEQPSLNSRFVKRKHYFLNLECFSKSVEFYNKYVKDLKNQKHKALLCVLLLTGCKVSEAISLLKSDFGIKKSKMGKRENFCIVINQITIIIPYDVNEPIINEILCHTDSFVNPHALVFPIGRNYAWKIVKAYFGNEYSPKSFRNKLIKEKIESGRTKEVIAKKFGFKSNNGAWRYFKPEPIDVRPELPNIQPIIKKKEESEDWW